MAPPVVSLQPEQEPLLQNGWTAGQSVSVAQHVRQHTPALQRPEGQSSSFAQAGAQEPPMHTGWSAGQSVSLAQQSPLPPGPQPPPQAQHIVDEVKSSSS